MIFGRNLPLCVDLQVLCVVNSELMCCKVQIIQCNTCIHSNVPGPIGIVNLCVAKARGAAQVVITGKLFF
jgi:hypothetical protein